MYFQSETFAYVTYATIYTTCTKLFKNTKIFSTHIILATSYAFVYNTCTLRHFHSVIFCPEEDHCGQNLNWQIGSFEKKISLFTTTYIEIRRCNKCRGIAWVLWPVAWVFHPAGQWPWLPAKWWGTPGCHNSASQPRDRRVHASNGPCPS